MTWFKVDDGLHSHRKAVRAGTEAMGLWVLAGSWSADQLTDGWVPDYIAARLDPQNYEANAKRLVTVGLWVDETRDGEAGWQFHQWGEPGRQPSREQVLADRASNARRQALVRNPELRQEVRDRDRDTCRYCGVAVRWTDRRGPCGGTYDHIDPDGPNSADNLVVACRACNSRKGSRTPELARMRLIPLGEILGTSQNVSRSDLDTDLATDLDSSQPPTRPDPTRPELPSEVLFDTPASYHADTTAGKADEAAGKPPAKTAKAPAKKAGTRLPDDFTVTPEMVAWASEKCPLVDGRAETERFTDHWLAATRNDTKRNWEAAWRTWMRNAQERLESRGVTEPWINRPRQAPANGLAVRQSGGLGQISSPADRKFAKAVDLARQFAERDGS